MPGIMNMPDNGNPELNTNRCFFMPMPINAILPAGMVIPFAGDNAPNGWLLCNGSAVSRTEYAQLFSVIGTKYGEGDGSTTFNLPNLVDKFIEGNDVSGIEKEAGLPNITGTYPGVWGMGQVNTTSPTDAMAKNGCIHVSSWNNGFGLSAGSADRSIITGWNINASRSSAIYGKSNTVQPPAITMRYLIKI